MKAYFLDDIDEVDATSFADHAMGFLASKGVTPETLLSFSYPDDKTRFQCWLAESVLYAIGECRRCDWNAAFRGYAQAKEYKGRLGGFTPTPQLDDALSWLRKILEDVLRTVPRPQRAQS